MSGSSEEAPDKDPRPLASPDGGAAEDPTSTAAGAEAVKGDGALEDETGLYFNAEVFIRISQKVKTLSGRTRF